MDSIAIALLPIIWLIILLGVMRMPAARACVIGLVLTIVLAIVSFKLPVLVQRSQLWQVF